MRVKLSLEAQVTLLALTLISGAVALVGLLHYWVNNLWLASIFAMSLLLPIGLIIIRSYMRPVNRVLSALDDGFHNFLDNDFSVSLAKNRNDELGNLVEVFNRVSHALRNERVHLYQRELLLDTVIQTTPLSLVLVDDVSVVIYSNNAARQLLASGKAINGMQLSKLLENQPAPFERSINSGLNGLFTIAEHDSSETYHLTQSEFLLNGRKHRLFLFKRLTKELSRQEVSTWKKVIRLISHELNNSLAPITSLAHSGQLLSERLAQEKLQGIFSIVEERAKHLQQFIEGYAEFARLPKPRLTRVALIPFLDGLSQIRPFIIHCDGNAADIYCDSAQMQQVVINLIKNAYESESAVEAIELIATSTPEYFEFQIKDRGKGMSSTHLSNALLPFYSTKIEGSGLGLPLCREIVEAHGGRLLISNRANGGLLVTLMLPNPTPETPPKTTS